MKRLFVLFVVLVIAAAACASDDDTTADDGGGGDNAASGSAETEGDSSSGGDDGGGGDGGDDAGSGDGGGDDDDDDAADIVGNPDLDLEELAEVAPDAAEALDDIDDIVSIGDCRSEMVGLEMTYVPADWQCRVLDAPVGGLDGFTLFKPENPGGLEVTIGTPSPIGPVCEVMQACDQVEPLDLGSNFNVEVFEFGGIPFIFGTHVNVEAELAVTTTSPLSDDDISFLTEVLNGVAQI